MHPFRRQGAKSRMQLTANTVIAFCTILLIGLGFALIYRTTHFFHFAHAVVFTSCPYFALALVQSGVPLGAAIPAAVVLSALLGCAMEIGVYRPLRRRGASSMILLLASLGLYVFLQNTISLIFGDDTKTLRTGVVKVGIDVFGARITPIQIATIAVSAVLVIIVAVMLKTTKMGKAMRAVAADADLARVSGIDSDRVILWTFAVASALAGVAGILVALDVDMTPTMGMNALMMGVVAVIIGGVGSIPGIVLGALLIGFAQNFGAYWLSSQWQDAIVFGVLLIFLLLRPQGFLGKRVKRVSV
jgi:branched-chain amino acid transport system permease protein